MSYLFLVILVAFLTCSFIGNDHIYDAGTGCIFESLGGINLHQWKRRLVADPLCPKSRRYAFDQQALYWAGHLSQGWLGCCCCCWFQNQSQERSSSWSSPLSISIYLCWKWLDRKREWETFSLWWFSFPVSCFYFSFLPVGCNIYASRWWWALRDQGNNSPCLCLLSVG